MFFAEKLGPEVTGSVVILFHGSTVSTVAVK
jgi:hypothetical protein